MFFFLHFLFRNDGFGEEHEQKRRDGGPEEHDGPTASFLRSHPTSQAGCNNPRGLPRVTNRGRILGTGQIV